MSTSVKATDSVLLWPLVRLAKEAFSHQHDDLQSSELANSIECRLFRGFPETEIIAGAEISPEFLESSERYVVSTETLLAERGPDAEPPRSTGDRPYCAGWSLHSLVGRPDQGLLCQ